MINLKTAIFIDYENIHWSLKEQFSARPAPEKLISVLKEFCDEHFHGQVVFHAFADFDLEEFHGVQTKLQQKAVLTHHVYGKTISSQVRKNASDIELSLEAQEAALRDASIDNFVIIGGDRDMIPLLRRLRVLNKPFYVIGVEKSTSRDLIEFTEGEFTPLEELLGLIPDEKPDVASIITFGETQLCELIAKINLPFVGLKYLVEKVLPSITGSTETALALVNAALSNGTLETYSMPNPNNPERPTTAVRVARGTESVG